MEKRKYYSDLLKKDGISRATVAKNGYGIDYFNDEYTNPIIYQVEFWPFYVKQVGEREFVPDITKTNVNNESSVLENGKDYTYSRKSVEMLTDLYKELLKTKGATLVGIYKKLFNSGIISTLENITSGEDNSHHPSCKNQIKPSFEEFKNQIEEFSSSEKGLS